jgi:amino acid permease
MQPFSELSMIFAKHEEEDKMKERLSKLLTVKSIVTIVLTAVFAALALLGRIDTDQFMTVFTVVIAFYFGTQVEKKTQEGG